MLGAVAAAASVTVMIPMDTIKTRLVIQVNYINPIQQIKIFLTILLNLYLYSGIDL